VFFSSDAANPDTYSHFHADLQMYNVTMNAPDPQVFMAQFVTWEIASRENKWTGRNITRFRNEEYDRLWRAAETEMDPVKRAALFIRMNDLVIANVAVIPCSGATVSARPTPACTAWSSTAGTRRCGDCRTGTRLDTARARALRSHSLWEDGPWKSASCGR